MPNIRLNTTPKINSTAVTPSAQSIALNNMPLSLKNSSTSEKTIKHTPPAITIVQWVCPRHITSIAAYPTAPVAKKIAYFFTLLNTRSSKILLPPDCFL